MATKRSKAKAAKSTVRKAKTARKRRIKEEPGSVAAPESARPAEEDWPAKEARWKSLFVDRAKRAIALRSKDREFHGLEREFRGYQAQMTLDYELTKDVKHPRDLGDTRETILRKFLASSGCLPSRYGVSDRSVRVASTTGHMSREIDIALFDAAEAISLMNRQDVYQVLPVENVFGIIQVKSRLPPVPM